jgi:hypothetical protein
MTAVLAVIFVLTDGDGGRHWTRTSDLLHVKHFRLSAVLGAWRAEQNRRSYTVTPVEPVMTATVEVFNAPKELSRRL